MTTLTKATKATIIKAILADVPTVDYHSRIQALAEAAALVGAPESVFQLWAEGPGTKARSWVKSTTVFFDVGSPMYLSIRVPDSSRDTRDLLHMSPSLREAVEGLRVQNMKMDSLKETLEAQFKLVRTYRQFKEAYPEFESYLPPEPDAPTRNLPAASNLLAKLVESGWPREGSVARNKVQAKKSPTKKVPV